MIAQTLALFVETEHAVKQLQTAELLIVNKTDLVNNEKLAELHTLSLIHI